MVSSAMMVTTIKRKTNDGLLAPTFNSVAEVSIFRNMVVLVTPPLLFSHASTVCSMIPSYKLVFSFVLDNSFMRTKDSPKDSIHTSEDMEDPDPSVSYTTSVPMLFYQLPTPKIGV
jgi:hypothetical protein